MGRWNKKCVCGGIRCPVLLAVSDVKIPFPTRAVRELNLLSLLSVSEKETYKQIGVNVFYIAWTRSKIKFGR